MSSPLRIRRLPPLCGMGGGGGEHLLTWCPAVALCWFHLTGSTDFRAAIRTPSERGALLGAFLHQVVFYYGSLLGRHVSTTHESAAFLSRATRLRARSPLARDSLSDSDGGTSSDDNQDHPDTAVWTRNSQSDCPTCRGSHDPAGLIASSCPAIVISRGTPGLHDRWRPVARHPFRTGDALLLLASPEASGAWLMAGSGWVPRPRPSTTRGNATWHLRQCGACQGWTASLTATDDIAQHQEVVTDTAGPILGPTPPPTNMRPPSTEGARTVDGNQVAGAATVLWGPGPRRPTTPPRPH